MNNTPDNGDTAEGADMTTEELLAARAIAILTSRLHNASVYALRGCEDLDIRYDALRNVLRKASIHLPSKPDFDAAALHAELARLAGSDQAFARKLDRAILSPFSSAFGRLVSLVLHNWESFPQAQRALAAEGVDWVTPATESWAAGFREAMHETMVHVARQLYLFTNIWFLRRLARLLNPGQLHAARDFPGMAFPAVLDEELEEIEKLRGVASGAATAGDPQERADAANLAGLAFSGGGIRSATFNLGVLQFLGERGLLRRFDYLSTVSGGGYIGSWLHAWIHHSENLSPGQPGVAHVQRCLSPVASPDPQDERVGPIRFLRRYSNYLTPKTGLFSPDTWTMINIWLRNTFLNLLILVLALSSLLLAPYWMVAAAEWLDRVRHLTDYWWVLMIPPACLIGRNLASFPSDTATNQPRPRGAWGWIYREPIVLCLIVAPIFLAGWAAGTVVPSDLKEQQRIARDIASLRAEIQREDARQSALPQARQSPAGGSAQEREKLSRLYAKRKSPEEVVRYNSYVFAAMVAYLVFLVSTMAGIHRVSNAGRAGERRWIGGVRAYGWVLLVCFVAIAVTDPLDYLWVKAVNNNAFTCLQDLQSSGASQACSPQWSALQILTWSAPVFLLFLSITVFLYMGLLGWRLPDDRREWLARLGAWLGICSFGWMGLCFVPAYGPDITRLLATRRLWPIVDSGLAWLITTGLGLFQAVSERARARERDSAPPSGAAKILAAVVPGLFVVSSLVLLGLSISAFVERSALADHRWGILGLSILCGSAAIFLSRHVDINEFSLHQFYRNRLVRCYLGGARAGKRSPNPFTGFDGADDLRLTALAPSAGHSGPYPILNTTLNVVHGDELAWQERKGEAFAFTPRFCGFDVDRGRATHARTAGHPKLSYGGYRPTGDYAYPNPADPSPSLTESGIRLGTVMAVSGAAASPNMGSQTSSSLAFLMTVLDVRLGWWLGNPRRTDTWQKPGPTTGVFQLLAELTASTNDTGKFVYLSDGGHFENLAVYELIRRRCRYIVACDSEEDREYGFGGLGNLIRKCRADFGVEIDIDTTPIKPRPGERLSRVHSAVGTIRYAGTGGTRGPEGTLVYIKSSLTGDEPADVIEYSVHTPAFPHESTADQWFDESQFESYRTLGYHVAKSSFVELPETDSIQTGLGPFAEGVRELVALGRPATGSELA